MIHVVAFYPYIEKRVFGEYKHHEFHPETTRYTLGGVGMASYLKRYHIRYQLYGMIGQNIISLIDKQDATMKLMQMDIHSKTTSLVIAEDEILDRVEEESAFPETKDLLLYQMMIQSELKESDVVLLMEPQGILEQTQMDKLYTSLIRKGNLTICDVHEKYLSMLEKQPCNVLYVDLHHHDFYESADIVRYAQEHLAKLAHIVVCNVDSHRVFLLMNKEVYMGVHNVKNERHKNYHEAMMTAILKCYEAQGDITTLLYECVSLSVGASLSNGLYIPSDEVILLIKDKVEIIKYSEEADEKSNI